MQVYLSTGYLAHPNLFVKLFHTLREVEALAEAEDAMDQVDLTSTG